jgi:hypothetical protein
LWVQVLKSGELQDVTSVNMKCFSPRYEENGPAQEKMLCVYVCVYAYVCAGGVCVCVCGVRSYKHIKPGVSSTLSHTGHPVVEPT